MNKLSENIVFHPTEFIFPIMTYSPQEGRRTNLLGTGFLITASGVALTAKHIFQSYNEREEGLLGIFVDRKENVHNLKISIIHKSRNYDLAALQVAGIKNAQHFLIGGKAIHNNIDYVTVEYSRISFERDSSTGMQITSFNPSVHKGNVIITYVSEFPETVPTKTMEISFPVLQGASGAPLFEWDDPQHVIGMITHNIERGLVPAQTIRIQDGANYSEETKYFLPVGKAIHYEHISDFIEELRGLGLYH